MTAGIFDFASQQDRLTLERPTEGPTGDVTFDVLFCSNRLYFQHLAVAAVSLAWHSRTRPIRIHVMTCDDDPVSENRLTESLAPYENVRLEVHRVADARLGSAFIDKYVTKEAYLRLLAAEILPRDVQRLLYLDCDLVVLDDVTKLSQVDLSGAPFAAVPDFSWDGQPDRLGHLGIAPGQTYVNSGVLIFDLEVWRREGISRWLFEEIERYGSQLEYYDQDILNIAFQGRIALLDRRWNLQARTFEPWVRRELPIDHMVTRDARRSPGIIHYTTEEKPWLFRPRVKKRGLYFRFLEKTAWRDERPVLGTALRRAEYDLARLLLKTGVDVYEVIPVLRRIRSLRDRLVYLYRSQTSGIGT